LETEIVIGNSLEPENKRANMAEDIGLFAVFIKVN
jgi:hypothetical protein